MPDKTLFLTLRTFSATGGIEKVSRVAGMALRELACEQGGDSLKVLSMYDDSGDVDEKYFPAAIFDGFGENKLQFVYEALRQGTGCKQVILSHANLLLPGFLIKLLSPKTKLVLLAHGIEVWSPFPFLKKRMLAKCDQVIAVSAFTKARMISVHQVAEDKITVLNNCLDPFLQLPLENQRSPVLSKRYGLTIDNLVLITLTRLSSSEQYKGYDNVFFAVKELKAQFPQIKYLVVGKSDELEQARVAQLVKELGLEQQVIFTGFIPDDELAAHYCIADLYIMPSKKEGFGIVFIEAMYYGKPVIAGNKDGSVDALDNGRLGLLINPDDQQEIAAAIVKVFNDKNAYLPKRREVLAKFGYPVYKEHLREILDKV
ncbi:MAG: glycosyltransferase family 4 protein [Ferruginibacter sp.]